jgi:AGZA family xanthine/uracil permease-like MFS transporter
MKSGLSLSVGVFLCLIALKIAGLLIYDGMTFRGFGDLSSPTALPFYLSLALILLLERLKVRGAVLISIVVTSAFCAVRGIGMVTEPAPPAAGALFENFAGLDLEVILDPAMWGIILILFLVDFYGSVAKLIGIALNTNILTGGQLPRMRAALMIDGAATMLGSIFGTSSIVVYVESAVGIVAGGRTGLTALTCGLLMMVTFVAMPLIEAVPVAATTGALVFVATKLCPTPREILRFPGLDLLVLAAMQIIVIFTFSLDQAMLVGFVLYAARDIAARRAPNPYLVGSIACLVISLLLRIRGGH